MPAPQVGNPGTRERLKSMVLSKPEPGGHVPPGRPESAPIKWFDRLVISHSPAAREAPRSKVEASRYSKAIGEVVDKSVLRGFQDGQKKQRTGIEDEGNNGS